MLAQNNVLTRAEQEESTSAVCALGLSLLQALVADQRALLITDETADRDALEGSLADLAVDLGGRDDLGENRLAEIKELEEAGLPLQSLDVHKEGSRGVGDLGYVKTAIGGASEVLSRILDRALHNTRPDHSRRQSTTRRCRT